MIDPPSPAPVFILIGGPNGSGKTGILASRVSQTIPVINADEIARRSPRTDAKAAAAEARVLASEQVNRHLNEGKSFAIETTLNEVDDLTLVRRAKALNFRIEALLIWSGSLQTSIERVALRKSQGGHGVPAEEIRMRFDRAVRTLPLIAGVADLATVFDNSPPNAQPQAVMEAQDGIVTALIQMPPDWLASAFDVWLAPLALNVDLKPLAADPRMFRAQQLVAGRRAKTST